MLFIDKRNKIAPNIYIIDIGGYSFNAFEGLFFSNNGPYLFVLLNCFLKYFGTQINNKKGMTNTLIIINKL